MEIRIFKSKKRLELWQDGQRLESFPIGIGLSELGHKQHEGDQKTPEGEYEICVKNPKSRFHLSLGLNYPNKQDAARGFTQGLISSQDRDEIFKRIDQRKGSLWTTKLGGAIYIHGDLEGQAWSAGCIRMFNKDIDCLYHKVGVGTKVLIDP